MLNSLQGTSDTNIVSSQNGEFLEQFHHMQLSGLRRLPDPQDRPASAPLIVAVHGGTYTSRYFDLPRHSLLQRAGALGIPIVALDRAGYGKTTSLDAGTETTESQGKWLADVVGELFERYGKGAPGVFLIGHSIGAATVVEATAVPRQWPLLGIGISGICLRTPQESRDYWTSVPPEAWIEMDQAIKDALMFGPQNTRSVDMPQASHVAHSLVPRAEILDIVYDFPERVKRLLRQIDVPVHYRQGEFDPLWLTDEAQVSEFASELIQSPRSDVALFRGAGHCIDLHLLSASFHLEQLAFALRCSVEHGTDKP